MKKKYRLKIQYKILLFLLLIILTICLLYKHRNKQESIIASNLLNDVHDNIFDESIDKDFLEWIQKNYGDNALIELKNTDYDKTIWHEITGNSLIVLKDLYNNAYKEVDNVKIINNSNTTSSISFVGDVSLADDWKVMPKYDERNMGVKGILSESILDIMTNTDIMVANNEFTISNRGSKIPKAFNFRANPERIKIYNEMGVDLVTLANNHSYDYGPVAFSDMLTSLKEYNMPYIGAGLNINEAKKPYYFILNGYKISFVNGTRAEKNIVTPGATETESGVFRCYDPTAMIELIKEEKEHSDFVITLIHYGKEGYHELEKEQIESSKMYIDAGSDAIVGTHAHALQGIEFYNDKIIMYNLGDFIFNDKDEDTGIFQIRLDNTGKMSYYFYPAKQKDVYTDLLYNEEKTRLINAINSWSINAQLNEDNEIIKIL